MGDVMTSSPAPTPTASSARCSAAVHELTATQCAAPRVGGQILLEGLGARPGRQPSGAQRLEHRPLVVGVDERLVKRQERRSHRGSSAESERLGRRYFHAISFILGH